MNKSKVLVVAPSRKTRGGITAVVNAYTHTDLWQIWNCYWIETHIDKGKFTKLRYFLVSFFKFLFLLPSFEIIHIHLSEPVSALRKLFFFLPALLIRKKIILHFHSFSPDTTLNGKLKYLYKFLFRNSSLVIVLSQFWKEEMEKSIGKDIKIEILYNPSTSKVNASDSNKLLRLPTILFAGTLNERKGFKDLIEAFAKIAPSYPQWYLTFAGNGNISAGVELAERLAVGNQVKFLGWVSGNKKDEIFSQSSIFCLPSYAEGFPMAVLDAMSYSLPTITTPVGGILDVFSHENEVLIFEPGNTEELSRLLEKLINDSSLRNHLSTNASKIVSAEFNIKSLSDKLEKMYSKL